MKIQYHTSHRKDIPSSSSSIYTIMNLDDNSTCRSNTDGTKNSTCSTHPRGRGRMLLLPRHTKGFLLLSLFVFAESVTYSNAVNFWSTFQKKIDSDYRYRSSPYSKDDESNRKKSSSSLFASAQQASTDECTNSNYNLDGTCNAQSTVSTNPINSDRKNKLLSLFSSSNNNINEHCCNDCYNCMDSVLIQRLGCSATSDSGVAPISIPRGGHLAAAAAASTTNAAVTTPWNIPLNLWKIIFQFFLTSMNVLCWLVPLKSKHITQNEYLLAIANSFSGGVFLSLAFGHLIPECIHGFHAENYDEATPYMLVLAGYLLIFFVEKVAFSDAHDILHSQHGHTLPSESRTEPTKTITTENGYHNDINHSTTSNGHSTNDDVAVVVPPSPTNSASGSGSGRGAVILLGALAVHSILEMMALGLADTFSDSALLTLSISLHQPAESIALLVAFLKSGMSEQQVIWFLSIFSCMGPIGVALGMIVNEYATPIVDSIMLAIVAGTFVYVGATEVIPEEFENSEWKWHKFTSLMAGIISIYAITQYTMTLKAD